MAKKDILNNLLLQSSSRKAQSRGVPASRVIERNLRRDINKVLQAVQSLVKSELVSYLNQNKASIVRDSVPSDINAIIKTIRSKIGSTLFNQAANKIAESFLSQSNNKNLESFKRTFGSVPLFENNPEVNSILETSSIAAANLITTISTDYLDDVSNLVMANVRAGNRPSVIVKSIQKQFNKTKKRAAFIARDQTLKVNSALTTQRQVMAGFQFFEWIDSKDERVRHRHRVISNRVTAYGRGVYRYDNPPVSDSGEPILPGEDFNCRCTARPVTNEEVEQNKKNKRTKKGVRK